MPCILSQKEIKREKLTTNCYPLLLWKFFLAWRLDFFFLDLEKKDKKRIIQFEIKILKIKIQ